LYTEVPGLFRHLPEELRLRIVRRHLGPAPGWPMKERVAGKIPMRMGVSDLAAEIKGGKVRLTFTNADGGCGEVVADHVVAATGYRVDVERLGLLHDDLRSRIRAVENTPVLSANFESSVPGLYFVGIAAANSFGPMMRFAFGAAYTARKLARHLAADERVTGAPATRQTEVATR
jgi:pyruvate/2-oxoglutarate dehydrogenase complex dihydrolipoamide dehydrogenase (E3) component